MTIPSRNTFVKKSATEIRHATGDRREMDDLRLGDVPEEEMIDRERLTYVARVNTCRWLT
jgi:hypothetical protein